MINKRSIAYASIICVLALGGMGFAPPPVLSATAVNMNVPRIQMTQDDFDRLIEKLARLDLRDIRAVEQAIGVDFSDSETHPSPGWVEYSAKEGHNKIGATHVSYEKKVERDPAQGDGLIESEVQISLRFPDEDKLSCDTLWNKYGKEAYSFFPDRGLCLFRINGVRIFMGYSGQTPDIYASLITLTWEKSPRPERYPVIALPR